MNQATCAGAASTPDVETPTVSGRKPQFDQAFVCCRASSPQPVGHAFILASWRYTIGPELMEPGVELGVGSDLLLLLWRRLLVLVLEVL
jgi:hypothetical protein